jgi:hypothetical protein
MMKSGVGAPGSAANPGVAISIQVWNVLLS